MKDNAQAALPHLRAAATVAPDDPINLFTYAQGLLAMEGESHEGEADELSKRALRLAPACEPRRPCTRGNPSSNGMCSGWSANRCGRELEDAPSQA
jgi:hypothetical protein